MSAKPPAFFLEKTEIIIEGCNSSLRNIRRKPETKKPAIWAKI